MTQPPMFTRGANQTDLRALPEWTTEHEARFQTILNHHVLLLQLRAARPDDPEPGPFDLLARPSMRELLDQLLQVVPTEEAVRTAQAMRETF